MEFDEVFANPMTDHNPSHRLNLAVTTESFSQNSGIKLLSVQNYFKSTAKPNGKFYLLQITNQLPVEEEIGKGN